MKLLWHEEAWEEYLNWQSNKAVMKRINMLLKDISRNGYNCIGKPEPLKGNLSGYHSVRITEGDRIVFRIVDEHVEIIQCGTHYRQ